MLQSCKTTLNVARDLTTPLPRTENVPARAVATPHDLDAFFTLLQRDGTMALVGAPATPHPSLQVFNLIMKRRNPAGSIIGGMPEHKRCCFCAEHGIVADIEKIQDREINTVYERMLRGDVKYRFVIDYATLTSCRLKEGQQSLSEKR